LANVRFRAIADIQPQALSKGMKRAFRSGICIAGLAVLGYGYVWFSGSVTVHDDTGSVTAAVITNGRIEYPLFRLPGGTFFRVMPRFDGEIEVRCRDGSTQRGEYVTHHMSVSVRVTDDAPCRFHATSRG
jgi:hypothetical protein